MGFDLWITSNSPGEVSSWVGSVAPLLQQRCPDWTLRLLLVPCPYASGAEKRVAEAIPGLHEVWSPLESVRWLLGWKTSSLPSHARGAVLFLGGDPWHALLAARRLKVPAYGYFEGKSGWAARFQSAAFAYAEDASGPRPRVTGNLMADLIPPAPPRDGGPIQLGIFPGSRPWQVRICLGPMLEGMRLLAERFPPEKLKICLMQSPFVTTADLQRALDKPTSLGIAVPRARVDEDSIRLEQGGLVVERRRGGRGVSGLQMAFTIPGTNTAELACAGVPYAVGLHRLASLGGGGLLGLVELLPLPSAWKVPLRRRKARRLGGFTALPNRRAGRMIAPELVFDKSMQPVADLMGDWIEHPEQADRLAEELRHVMGEPGAAGRLVDWLQELCDA